MARAVPLLVAAAILCARSPASATAGDWSTAEGKRFTVHARTSGEAARVRRWAEGTGKDFEELLGLFPAVRACIVAAPPLEETRRARLDGTQEVDPAPAPVPGESWRMRFGGVRFRNGGTYLVAGEPDEETLFRHLLGHRLLAEWTARLPDGGPRADGSGCPLPDWFEEAVAVDMEPEVRKREYLRALRGAVRSGAFHPLPDLLSMRRPGGGRTGSGESRLTDGLPPEVRDALERILSNPASGDHAGGTLFEIQSWSLLEFLRREYGVPFLQHVAETFGANLGFSNAYPWLVEHREELRDPWTVPPSTDRELEAAWKAWAVRK